MDHRLLSTLRATEKAIARLIEKCRKGSPVHRENSRAAAQVTRTSKWLLNAIAALRRELDAAPSDEPRLTR
jgi:hypothetical protein